MKKLLFSLMAFTVTTGIFAQTTTTTTAAQKKADEVAKFKSETIDLGKIQQGNPTAALFSVQNIGTDPLIIEAANPTCGCTISDYTKEPIAAGKAGTIKATYNAANVGAFEKHLTVKFAGVTEVKSITIKGEVIAKDAGTAKAPAPADVKTAPASTEKPAVADESKMAVTAAAPATAPAPATKTKTVKKTDGKKTSKTKTKTESASKSKK